MSATLRSTLLLWWNIRQLRAGTPDKAIRAARKLGVVSDSRALDALLSALRHEDPEVCKAACEALARFGAPAGAPLLKAFEEFSRRADAEWEAGDKLRPKEKKYSSELPEPHRRRWILWSNAAEAAEAALLSIGSAALDPLLQALSNSNELLVKTAVDLLGGIKDSRAVDRLIEALSSPSIEISARAAIALGKIRDRRAVEPLIAALNNDALCDAAVTALGEIGDRRAEKPLVSLLSHPDSFLRKSVGTSLRKLGLKPTGPDTRNGMGLEIGALLRTLPVIPVPEPELPWDTESVKIKWLRQGALTEEEVLTSLVAMEQQHPDFSIEEVKVDTARTCLWTRTSRGGYYCQVFRVGHNAYRGLRSVKGGRFVDIYEDLKGWKLGTKLWPETEV